jgi:hypothetical protein
VPITLEKEAPVVGSTLPPSGTDDTLRTVLREAGLRYVDDSAPGITRRRRYGGALRISMPTASRCATPRRWPA